MKITGTEEGNIKSIQFYDERPEGFTGLTIELKNGVTTSYNDPHPGQLAARFIAIDRETPLKDLESLDDAWLGIDTQSLEEMKPASPLIN